MSPKRKLRLSKKPKASVVHGPKPFKRRPNHPQWVVDVFRSWRAAHPNSILYRDDKEALAARTGSSVCGCVHGVRARHAGATATGRRERARAREVSTRACVWGPDSASAGLSVEQVEYWFRNQRRRGAADVPSDASLPLDACGQVTWTLYDDCISAVDNAPLLLDAGGPVPWTLYDDCISVVDKRLYDDSFVILPPTAHASYE